MDWDVVAHGYGLAEAPTIDVDGSLVFSDVLGGGVYRVDGGGTVTTVVPKRRGVGGIAIHADGGIVCTGRDVIHVREGHEQRIVLSVDGVAGWNDLCTDATGRIYAGALRFAVFDPDAEVVPGELWRVGLEGDDPAIMFGDVVHANGVACTRDGRTIYLSDTRRQRVIVFDVETGSRRDIDVSALGHADGMALDDHGAIWLALVSGGIARLTPDGEVDRRIEPPSAFTTSLCFAGRDLYVTTGGPPTTPSCAVVYSAHRWTSPAPPSRPRASSGEHESVDACPTRRSASEIHLQSASPASRPRVAEAWLGGLPRRRGTLWRNASSRDGMPPCDRRTPRRPTSSCSTTADFNSFVFTFDGNRHVMTGIIVVLAVVVLLVVVGVAVARRSVEHTRNERRLRAGFDA